LGLDKVTEDSHAAPPAHFAVVRTTANQTRMRDWSLVLSATGISSWIRQHGPSYSLLVGADDAPAAVRALQAFDRENRESPAAVEAEASFASDAGLLTVGLLLLFHLVTGPRSSDSVWFAAGAAIGEKIRDGELWRCVTSLTLHADAVHVLGNAASGGLFISALCRSVGGGRGLFLCLLAGTIATLCNVVFRSSAYSGVGASTAIFAAVGLLAAQQVARRRQRRGPVWRTWAPLGAALAILAFLGADPSTDVLAHLWGLAVGAGLGFAARVALPAPPEGDAVFSVLTVAVVAASWALALLA
jgi:rhomboid protease GluP